MSQRRTLPVRAEKRELVGLFIELKHAVGVMREL